MKSTYFWLVVASFSGLTFISSCKKEEKKAPVNAPVPVNVIKVTAEEVTGTDAYPGTVVPLQEVQLRPQVAGYITAIYVTDGQKVTQGQKLYEIDRSKYQAAYQQSVANVQSAQANLDRVKKDLERYERLSEREAIAKQQVDYARANFKTAQAQLSSAQAQLQSVATDLNYSIINAPFSGNIGISQVRVGSQVSPGQPILNTISSDDPIAVDFVINEKEIPRFNKLIQAKAKTDSAFTIVLSDGSIYPHHGKLIVIDRAVDRQTGTITVRLSFPNKERGLIAGMMVNVKILNQDIGKQTVIPYKAVVEQMGEYYVYVVTADSVQQRKLDLGTRFSDKVVVRTGLQDGETVVVEGVQRLRQGAKITTSDAPPAQASGAKK
jgi:membrane fusion protein (multidrug efflux system)